MITEEDNEELKQKKIADDGRVFHMWEPLSFNVSDSYDYGRNGVVERLQNVLLRSVASLILSVFDYFAFGYTVDGRENLDNLGSEGAISICNHIHPMDCTMVDMALYKRRMYYMTIEANFKIPAVRHIIRWLGAVPITKSPHKMMRLFKEMEKAVKSGAFVQIYPEGVLMPYAEGLREFRSGAFKLAVKTNVPIVPMVIRQEKPCGIFAYKNKPCLKLKILPPVFPDKKLKNTEAANKIKNECITAMQNALDKENDSELIELL